MKLAFCLFAYRPWGGLQRDFFRIATTCAEAGHEIEVLTMEWNGQVPPEFGVYVFPQQGRNHVRVRRFAANVANWLTTHQVDSVVGFNKIPGLDTYYAADPCYISRIERTRNRWYKLSGRYRQFASYERSIFTPEANTHILALTQQSINEYVATWKTPQHRFHLLPPGIDISRRATEATPTIRREIRKEFGIAADEKLLLMVGSGFRTKGLDRSISGLASLPSKLRQQSRLFVIGDDRNRSYRLQAKRLGLTEKVIFLGGRDDVPRFLFGADVLVHPAYSEAAGAILLESIVAGLPVLTTDVCGYAFHVKEANAGHVLTSPYSQHAFNQTLVHMLTATTARLRWSENGIRYGQEQELYNQAQIATEMIIDLARRR